MCTEDMAQADGVSKSQTVHLHGGRVTHEKILGLQVGREMLLMADIVTCQNKRSAFQMCTRKVI